MFPIGFKNSPYAASREFIISVRESHPLTPAGRSDFPRLLLIIASRLNIIDVTPCYTKHKRWDGEFHLSDDFS